jgi:hypothetical protein
VKFAGLANKKFEMKMAFIKSIYLLLLDLDRKIGIIFKDNLAITIAKD